MSKKRKKILAIGLAVALLMGVYPQGASMGFGGFQDRSYDFFWKHDTILFSRLLLQWVFVAAGTGMALLFSD